MKIERSILTSEYHNTYRTKSFDVVEKLPKLNEVIAEDEKYRKMYTDCSEYSGSDFCGEDRSYDDGYYKYYRLNYTAWYENENGEKEDENTDNYEYVAVFEKNLDEELDLTQEQNRGRS